MTSTRGRTPTISSEWRHEPGRLVRELQFRDYDCALRFANLIGGIDDFGHHAEICVMHGAGGRLRTTVRNLNKAGITEQELRLASKLDGRSASTTSGPTAAGAQPRRASSVSSARRLN